MSEGGRELVGERGVQVGESERDVSEWGERGGRVSMWGEMG